jgi:hypothetical protein
MPITGAQFEHFMAFMEQDFRIFDFYVGMADAYAYLEREGCFFAPEGASCQADGSLRRLDAALKDANPNYRCIRAYYDSEESRVLKRISTDQLPEECQALREVVCDEAGGQDSEESVAAFLESGAVSSEAGEDACIAPSIANHNFRALLASMHNYKVWMQSEQYSEADQLDRFFDELSEGAPSERFIYVDLPTHLESDDGYLGAAEVKQAFRSLVQESIGRLAAEQEGMNQYSLKLGGRAAADAAYGREYPKHILGLGGVGNDRLQLGKSGTRCLPHGSEVLPGARDTSTDLSGAQCRLLCRQRAGQRLQEHGHSCGGRLGVQCHGRLEVPVLSPVEGVPPPAALRIGPSSSGPIPRGSRGSERFPPHCGSDSASSTPQMAAPR